MNKVEVSTPGKLMLFGEHAVVYSKPCIVTAVDQRMRVSLEKTSGSEISIDAPEVDITGLKLSSSENDLNKVPKGGRFIASAINNFGSRYQISSGLRIQTSSEFSSQFGFGSSSAVTAGTIKGLAALYEIEINNNQLFELAYKSVLDVQGIGSGFDLAAAIWGGTLYFVTGGKQIKPLDIDQLPLMVGYTGVKADTTTWIKRVADRRTEFPELINGVFNSIENVVNQAKLALELESWEKVGKLMDINQGLLEMLGVGTIELANLIFAARLSGAFGAKLSGAGGGDCMIAIGRDKNKIEAAMEQNGGQIIQVKTNAQGARYESNG